MTLATPPHCRAVSVSPRIASPASAATAGSMLMSTPKMRAGSRRRASSSKAYGSTPDSIPTAAASSQELAFAPDTSGRPMGAAISAPIAMATPAERCRGWRRPTAAEVRM